MQFGFSTAGDIRFGRGEANSVAQLATGTSKRVLLIHGKSEARASWLVNDLRAIGATVHTVSCTREPDLSMVEAAVAVARDIGPGVVVALGGGSTIDLGKATAALAPAGDDVIAYLEVVGGGLPLPADPIPFIAIPTTAGTGAEVTKNAVISVQEHRRKVSLRDARMFPDIAVVDPALTDGAPRAVTFTSGLDAVTQVIEPFLSRKASPLTDALCRDAIPRSLKALVRLAEGEDPRARDDIALASLFGGVALANAGLGAVHGLAGVLGGQLGAPHGELCATLLPEVLRQNADVVTRQGGPSQKIDEVHAWIADALGADASEAPDALQAWMTDIGIRDLGAMGLRPELIEEIAVAARTASSSKTNPVPPEDFDFVQILRAALHR